MAYSSEVKRKLRKAFKEDSIAMIRDDGTLGDLISLEEALGMQDTSISCYPYEEEEQDSMFITYLSGHVAGELWLLKAFLDTYRGYIRELIDKEKDTKKKGHTYSRKNLEGMLVSELRKIAAKEEIELPKGRYIKKEVLINLILERSQAAGTSSKEVSSDNSSDDEEYNISARIASDSSDEESSQAEELNKLLRLAGDSSEEESGQDEDINNLLCFEDGQHRCEEDKYCDVETGKCYEMTKKTKMPKGRGTRYFKKHGLKDHVIDKEARLFGTKKKVEAHLKKFREVSKEDYSSSDEELPVGDKGKEKKFFKRLCYDPKQPDLGDACEEIHYCKVKDGTCITSPGDETHILTVKNKKKFIGDNREISKYVGSRKELEDARIKLETKGRIGRNKKAKGEERKRIPTASRVTFAPDEAREIIEDITEKDIKKGKKATPRTKSWEEPKYEKINPPKKVKPKCFDYENFLKCGDGKECSAESGRCVKLTDKYPRLVTDDGRVIVGGISRLMELKESLGGEIKSSGVDVSLEEELQETLVNVPEETTKLIRHQEEGRYNPTTGDRSKKEKTKIVVDKNPPARTPDAGLLSKRQELIEKLQRCLD